MVTKQLPGPLPPVVKKNCYTKNCKIMKTFLKLSLLLFCNFLAAQAVLSQACTFVSPMVEVVSSKDSTAPDGSKYCVETVTLSVDIDINNGNKYTYIHLWTADTYHNTSATFSYKKPPTNADILANDILTLGLNYVDVANTFLTSVYTPDPTENPRMMDAADGVTFTTCPCVTTPGATHFIFSNIRIITPSACNPNVLYKGDSWSSQSDHGTTVQCILPGFVFALNDPVISSSIRCAPADQANTLDFNVTATGSNNKIDFQFDVYLNTDAATAFDPNTDTKMYTGSTTYTVTSGTSSSTLNFTSAATALPGHISIPAIYPAPYSTEIPGKFFDVYIVIRDIVITNNGGTPTPIQNALVEVSYNVCQSLPITFGEVNATNRNGQLVINWQTLKEENSGEFIIEASKDGSKWHEIGRAVSKAGASGSTSALHYSYSVQLPAILLSLLPGLLLLTIFKSRIFRIFIILFTIGILAACLKKDKGFNVPDAGTVYIRVVQYNQDGKATYSKIVQMVKE